MKTDNFLKLLALLALLLPFAVQAQSIDWYNDSDTEFEISTADELRGLAALVNGIIPNSFAGKTIKLTDDIDLGEENWTPIGTNSTTYAFKGVFDGRGHTISGLAVNQTVSVPYTYAGLFGYVDGGQITNINVVASVIKTATNGTGTYAGGLAGYYKSGKPIENSSVKVNSIENSYYSGGLVGYGEGITIKNSYSEGSISAITSSTYNGSSSYSGGLAGYASTGSIIKDCYSTGDISADNIGNTYASFHSYSGGLVGYGESITIENSHSEGNISASAVASYSHTNSYSGGLMGGSSGNATIKNSYSEGDVSALAATSHSGGLMGIGSGDIEYSFSEGDISAIGTYTHSGGLVGYGGGRNIKKK